MKRATNMNKEMYCTNLFAEKEREKPKNCINENPKHNNEQSEKATYKWFNGEREGEKEMNGKI